MSQSTVSRWPILQIGEPGSRQNGFVVFAIGYLISLVGIALFLGGGITPTANTLLYREVGIAMAALGLPIALFGIVLLLPIGRRGVWVALLGGIGSVVAIGMFTTVYPTQGWALGTTFTTTVIAVYTAGVGTIAGVATVVPYVTGNRRLLDEPAGAKAGDRPAIMLGDALRGATFAVFRDDGHWTWRLIEEDAVAETIDRYGSWPETEDQVERVKDQIAGAGMLDIEGALFKLYEGADGRWRWMLVGEDGSVVAQGGDDYESSDAAEEAVSLLKEFGPDADPLAIDGAAFDYTYDADRWRWRLIDESRSAIATGSSAYDTRQAAAAVTDRIRRSVDVGTLSIEHLGVELFEATEGDGDEWRWRMLDAEDSAVLDGTVGYRSRQAAEAGVSDVLEGIGSAPVVEAGEPIYAVMPRRSGAWYWRLVDAGDDVVARSHGDADSREAAERSAGVMRSAAADAGIIEIERADYEVFPTRSGWRWRLVDGDRTTLAEGPSTFETRDGAEAAVQRAREEAPVAELFEVERAAFQIYEIPPETEGASEWRWRLIDAGGEVLADSGDDYFAREEAIESMMTLKEHAPDADFLEIDTATFELFEEADGLWFWRLIDEGGDLLARSGDGHPSRDAARRSMDRLAEDAADAELRVMETAAFQVFAAEGGDWSWRFLSADGSTVAEATTTHATRDQTTAAIEDLREDAATGAVTAIEDVAISLTETDGMWRWSVTDRDRDVLATSAGPAVERDRVEETIAALRQHGADAVVFDIEDAVFRLDAEDGSWVWSLIDESRSVLMRSPEAYADEPTARRAIDRVRRLAPDALDLEVDGAAFEVTETDDGWQWRLVDEHERTLARATEPHETRADALDEVEAIRGVVGEASILEVDTATFELVEADGGWRWRLVDEDGRSMGNSLPVYASRTEARESMRSVKELTPTAPTVIAEYE